ncbi:MAG: hypothetical protein FWE18_01985 [Alphaproteobacteria bacterium]|nr:hypothetical protein [Alphaproteobacteria bacterium]
MSEFTINWLLTGVITFISIGIASFTAAWIVYFISQKEIRYKRRLAIKYTEEVLGSSYLENNIRKWSCSADDFKKYKISIPCFVFSYYNQNTDNFTSDGKLKIEYIELLKKDIQKGRLDSLLVINIGMISQDKINSFFKDTY